MSRRSRLHVPGGFYYVVQRSNGRQRIFTEASDYTAFGRLLATALSSCRARVHACCLQPLGIHLIVQISDVPLGRLMQRITSQYARAVHRRAGEQGHLFQQRYHALLFDPDAYLLKLIRYLHSLPVQPAQVDSHGCPPNSDRVYAGRGRIPWLTTADALRLLGAGKEPARAAYRRLMSTPPDPVETAAFEQGGMDPRVLGDAGILAATAVSATVHRSSDALEELIDAVVRRLAVRRSDVISKSRQRRHSMARALIAWHATQRGVASLKQVADRLQRDPSTLFVAMERYRRLRPELFDLSLLQEPGPPAQSG